jgi:hypothetical protein
MKCKKNQILLVTCFEKMEIKTKYQFLQIKKGPQCLRRDGSDET